MLNKSFEYPMNFDETSDYIIGGLLWFVSMLFVIPYVVAYGYLIKVLRTTIDGSEKPPSFSDISVSEMIMDGLKFCGIYVIYVLPPTIIYGVLLNYEVLPESILVTLLWFVMVIVNYIVMASILVYANNTFKDAFKPSLLKPILLSKEYLKATLILFAIGLIIGIVTFIVIFILLFIPIVGWLMLIFIGLISPVLIFCYSLFRFRLYGLAYEEILNK